MPPPTQRSRLVLVSPHGEDHSTLRRILHGPVWQVNAFLTGRKGLNFLCKHPDIAVVICEEKLSDGDWIHLMKELENVPAAPTFIVTARFADDRLWAEALNLGAFDVLVAGPFEVDEVVRVTESAWLAWDRAHGRNAVTRTSLSLESRARKTGRKTRTARCA